MLTDRGWPRLPAFDINPVATGGRLALNISKEDNSQDLDLVLSIAPYFRVRKDRANEIIQEITTVVRSSPNMAKRLSIPSHDLRRTWQKDSVFHLMTDVPSLKI
jgi:serine/threonine-protein kinase HipA